MTEGVHNATESKRGDLVKFLTPRLKLKTKGTPIWVVIMVISIALLLFWAGALVYAYVADDRSTMPADERSVPVPRPY